METRLFCHMALSLSDSYGNWMFPVIGLSMLALRIVGIVIIRKKSRKENS